MDYRGYRQRRPTSVDGIYRPAGKTNNQAPTHKLPSADYLRRPAAAPQPQPQQPVAKPQLVASRPQPLPRQPLQPSRPSANAQSNPSQPSYLNASLPNREYLQRFNTPPITDGKDEGKSKRAKNKKGWTRKRKVLTSVLVAVFIFAGFGAWFGAKIIGNVDKVFHGNVFSDAHALFSDANLKESNGRINILLAGDSTDDPGHPGADLTDSIMVLSINPTNHTGFMLSIPRDMWVYVPSYHGYQKINTANTDANFSESGYPSGGMGQLQYIVQTELGIPIDYNALINYEAFKDAVNAVGGITVDIQSPDPRGLYDAYTHLKLPNGEDALNGQEALNLARARGDDGGDVSYGFPDTDYDRTEHQRQMLVAVAKKATTLGVLTNPVKISQLFDAVGNNIQTDLSLQDGISLAQLTKTMNLNNLGSYTYSSTITTTSSPLLTDYTDPVSGEDALAPSAGVGDYSQIKEYFQQLTSNNPLVKEDASVEILNGSDVIGLAQHEETVLDSKGVANVGIADATAEYPGTMIIDQSGGQDPNTKQLLEQMFPGTTVTTATGSSEAGEAAGYKANFVVVLGKNWDGTNVTSTTNSGN